MSRPNLVLASTSPYRRELLARLRMSFEVDAPGTDESPRAGETPAALVERLARQKALAVAARHADALIIGSDQVAVLDGEPLSKPGTHDRAVAQLRGMRGRRIEFLTGLAVHSTVTGATHSRVVPFSVEFRDFSDAEIEVYLEAERPYDCAGAAKAEGLGIALIHRMQGDDPNALIGLPLIALVELLALHGVTPLG
jgi:septum formation protein